MFDTTVGVALTIGFHTLVLRAVKGKASSNIFAAAIFNCGNYGKCCNLVNTYPIDTMPFYCFAKLHLSDFTFACLFSKMKPKPNSFFYPSILLYFQKNGERKRSVTQHYGPDCRLTTTVEILLAPSLGMDFGHNIGAPALRVHGTALRYLKA